MRNMVFVVGVLACWFNSAMVANASIDKKVLTYRTFCSLHRLRTMSRNSEKSYVSNSKSVHVPFLEQEFSLRTSKLRSKIKYRLYCHRTPGDQVGC